MALRWQIYLIWIKWIDIYIKWLYHFLLFHIIVNEPGCPSNYYYSWWQPQKMPTYFNLNSDLFCSLELWTQTWLKANWFGVTGITNWTLHTKPLSTFSDIRKFHLNTTCLMVISVRSKCCMYIFRTLWWFYCHS